MKHLHLLVLIFFSFTQYTFSQWYFETGVNDTKFTKYNDSNPTTIHSYTGLRDFSHAVGYIFPGKKLAARAQSDAKAAALRFKIGLGFDQMSLRLKAVKQGGGEALHHYDLGQLQARMGFMYTPTLVRKKQTDHLGVRQPAINLIFDAVMAYNFYTSATRTLINGTGSIRDLKVDNEFDRRYPAYTFGAGFEFPLNRHTALYAKYEVENAFSTKEDTGVINSEEKFSAHKQRAIVGLRVDFRLKNHLKRQQLDRIAALEEGANDSDELDALRQKMNELEDYVSSNNANINAALQAHIQDTDMHGGGSISFKDIQDEGAIFKIEGHDNGFMYLPGFKHVLFPLNRSYFNRQQYGPRLASLATFLQNHTQYRIKLVGYADAKTGSDKYNMRLSAKRAKRVYEYLKKLGVPANRMEHMSYGGTLEFTLGEDITENRRTEILIFE